MNELDLYSHFEYSAGRIGKPGDNYVNSVDWGWHDIIGQINVRGIGANDPDWAQIGSSAFYAYKFALNDQCWISFHVPHDIVPGTLVYFHVHWLSDGTSVDAVKWQFDYMYSKGFNQGNFNTAGATVTAQQSAAGSAYRHMVTESDGVNIPGLTEPDGIIYLRLRRITNGGTDNTDGIFVLTSDVHYQSTSLPTANKAPDFYAS